MRKLNNHLVRFADYLQSLTQKSRNGLRTNAIISQTTLAVGGLPVTKHNEDSESIMSSVTVSYDSQNETYDAFAGCECVYYGTADELLSWLVGNGYKMKSELEWVK